MKKVYTIAMLALTIFSLNCSSQDWVELGDPVEGSLYHEEFGSSLACNGDGLVIAVGNPYNDDMAIDGGMVKAFQYREGSWVQMGDDFYEATNNAHTGWSVALNSTGDLLAIGIPANSGGYVKVFLFDGSDWSQKGSTIAGGFPSYGKAISLSADGGTMAVSDMGFDDNRGKVQIFKFDATEQDWVLNGEAFGGYHYEYFGTSISLSDDGTILAGGAPEYSGATGRVKVFENTEAGWIQATGISGETSHLYFGKSVSLSEDGSRMAVGSYGYIANSVGSSGRTQVFESIENEWIQVGDDIIAESGGDRAGYSVSIADKGSRVAIGAPANDGATGDWTGQVRIYDFDGSLWSQVGKDIDGESGGNYFGQTVSLSGNGLILAASEIYYDGVEEQSGRVRILEYVKPLGASSTSPVLIKVYPNPACDFLNIQSTDGAVSDLEIIDITGKSVMIVDMLESGIPVDISHLKAGVYIIRLAVHDQPQTYKFIISR